MGLDLYVGTLTRYYSGQWDTIVAQIARASGTPFTIIRPEGSPAPNTDPETGEAMISKWRDTISDSLAEYLPTRLYWLEGMEPPYFSDKPDWDGLGGLILWAMYQEHPNLRRPSLYVKDWAEDPAFKVSNVPGFQSRYLPVLTSQLWLPGGAAFAYQGPDAANQNILTSFSSYLKSLLDELNDATWRANEAELQTWRMRGPAAEGHSFEHQAQFGFSVFYQQAHLAVQHNLPMKVDF